MKDLGAGLIQMLDHFYPWKMEETNHFLLAHNIYIVLNFKLG